MINSSNLGLLQWGQTSDFKKTVSLFPGKLVWAISPFRLVNQAEQVLIYRNAERLNIQLFVQLRCRTTGRVLPMFFLGNICRKPPRWIVQTISFFLKQSIDIWICLKITTPNSNGLSYIIIVIQFSYLNLQVESYALNPSKHKVGRKNKLFYLEILLIYNFCSYSLSPDKPRVRNDQRAVP